VADSEKITINMSVVDLGKIDLLVAEGHYTNRTDCVRTAVRDLLSRHGRDIEGGTSRRTLAVGLLYFNRADLEAKLERGELLAIRTVGLVVLADDVTPELARDTIESIRVFGVLRCPDDVRSALADRIG
jgi:Arc/MetJ-type ribon-helix-helix transcriptional regulator